MSKLMFLIALLFSIVLLAAVWGGRSQVLEHLDDYHYIYLMGGKRGKIEIGYPGLGSPMDASTQTVYFENLVGQTFKVVDMRSNKVVNTIKVPYAGYYLDVNKVTKSKSSPDNFSFTQ